MARKEGIRGREATENIDMKSLYYIVTELTGPMSNFSDPFEYKMEKTLLDTEEQNAQCLEHFMETLNQLTPTKPFTSVHLHVQVI